MTYRHFAVILLCFAPLFSNAVFGETNVDSTGIVQAYRKPSEDDLQWLFGNNTTNPNEIQGGRIVQVRAPVTDLAHPIVQMSLNILPPPEAPREPEIVLPRFNALPPETPREPEILLPRFNAPPPEVPQEPEIAPPRVDALPPEVPQEPEIVPSRVNALPPEAPRELDIVLPRTTPSPPERIAPLPVHHEKIQLFDTPDDTDCWDNVGKNWPCLCPTCLICGSERRQHAKPSAAPNMLGGSAWLPGYSVGTTGDSTMQFTLPTMLMSRPNVAEYFNAAAQTRTWADFRHWNNAVSLNGESRGVEQFSFGLEAEILQGNSVELRLPVFYQFGSGQSDAVTSAELGNISVFLKHVFSRNMQWTIACGGGVSVPTAKNWQPDATSELRNDVYYLVPFVGIQWHPDKRMFGQFVLQYDVPIEKYELSYGGNSVSANGQEVFRAGLQLGHWLYRADRGKRPCRVGAFAEFNYALVTKGSPSFSSSSDTDGIFVSNLHSGESTLTAALGLPMVFGKLTSTNAFILPISLGERPFSVGYNFSLSREF
ncbi:MAG: hypothetical protein FWG73_07440 [Planctomycetaceae bacterium]|nr:hypothetical protein [Planctomycetaceae bacterium]